jgi:hypothetical protein
MRTKMKKLKKKKITSKQLQMFLAQELEKLGRKLEKIAPNDEQYSLYLLFSMTGGLLSQMTCKKHFKEIVSEILKNSYEK